jgi:molybdate transport repressor ModE-like protein
MAHTKLTLVMKSGSRIGPGKAALLESIQSTGSISAAARAMGMDYKRVAMMIVRRLHKKCKRSLDAKRHPSTFGTG